MRLEISWLLMLCTRLTVLTQQTQDYQYWWLGLQSPFGGRNYNLEEVGGGSHQTVTIIECSTNAFKLIFLIDATKYQCLQFCLVLDILKLL